MVIAKNMKLDVPNDLFSLVDPPVDFLAPMFLYAAILIVKICTLLDGRFFPIPEIQGRVSGS